MEKQLSENKMGVMPVGRLLFNMAGPMIVSMLVQALYNVVDSVFVAQLNEDALSALSLAFPMQNFMIAVGTGLGVGVNALISRSSGGGQRLRHAGAAIGGHQLCGFPFDRIIGGRGLYLGAGGRHGAYCLLW